MKLRLITALLLLCVVSLLDARGQQRPSDQNSKAANLADDVVVIRVDAPNARPLVSTDEAFTINSTFSANITAAQQAVIQQALNEWLGIIQGRGFTPANYPISFTNGSLPGSTLALTTTTIITSTGNLVSATMTIDNDGNFIDNNGNTVFYTWYVDPAPADDTEFTPPSTPPAGFDLLTVIRHEIGHAVGWTGSKRVTDFTSASVFDQSRLNIAISQTGGTHTDAGFHVNDLMNPTIGPSARRPISLYPDSAMLARAFEYDITMRFVDGNYSGAETGSAKEPWNTFKEGIDLTPQGMGLLVTPVTYHEPAPLSISRPMIISAARSGNAVIGP